MQRSMLAKWALSRRVEAHISLPALLALVLLVIHFFIPAIDSLVQSAIAVPFISDRRAVGLGDLVCAFLMAWTAILCFSTLMMTRVASVTLTSILILVALLWLMITWLDGNSLTNRLTGLWADPQGAVSQLLLAHGELLRLSVVAGFSLAFFGILPLVSGQGRAGAATGIIPSGWLLATTAVLFSSLLASHHLKSLGWEPAGGSLAPLVMPLFLYQVLLYTARIQYRCWVRTESDQWNPSRRIR